MSRADLFWWVALPYMAIAIFVVGHIWRYRFDQLGWTARSTQLLEQRLLKWGSLLFHFGVLAVIGGHDSGTRIPSTWPPITARTPKWKSRLPHFSRRCSWSWVDRAVQPSWSKR